ncbi:MAG TPA: hypothetical protein VNO34_02205 [Actinomycetota bacterium]|nr:hypothetical protein [Actinomycetota bacterium]
MAFNLAWACDELGDWDRARALTEDNLRRARASGDRRNEGFWLDHRGTYRREEGRADEALLLFREGLRIRLELVDPIHITDGLSWVASALAVAGGPQAAARLVSKSVALNEELMGDPPLYQQKTNQQTLEVVRKQRDEAAFAEAWEQGRAMTLDEAVDLALGS